MQKEQTIVEKITDWALENPDIRVVLLTGSRANPNGVADILSDYDIELAVYNYNSFVENQEWFSHFGEVLITIDGEEKNHYMRMVIYKEYMRIDFRVYSIENFVKVANQEHLIPDWDIGYTVLLDKNNYTKGIRNPGYKAFIIQKPSQKKFTDLIIDFWWDITYVAKSLKRDELFYAKYMLDSVIRFSYFNTMIEWYIGLQNDWQITTNKKGRFFKRYLDTKIWNNLEKTFAGSVIEENREALFSMIEIFSQLTIVIAEKLHYTYPESLNSEITEYLQQIKNN